MNDYLPKAGWQIPGPLHWPLKESMAHLIDPLPVLGQSGVGQNPGQSVLPPFPGTEKKIEFMLHCDINYSEVKEFKI